MEQEWTGKLQTKEGRTQFRLYYYGELMDDLIVATDFAPDDVDEDGQLELLSGEDENAARWQAQFFEEIGPLQCICQAGDNPASSRA